MGWKQHGKTYLNMMTIISEIRCLEIIPHSKCKKPININEYSNGK